MRIRFVLWSVQMAVRVEPEFVCRDACQGAEADPRDRTQVRGPGPARPFQTAFPPSATQQAQVASNSEGPSTVTEVASV